MAELRNTATKAMVNRAVLQTKYGLFPTRLPTNVI